MRRSLPGAAVGAAGSLVSTAQTMHQLPALPGPVVDETGVGNAYCGAFVVGYLESGGDPVVGSQYGSVSASFTLAQVGVPRLGGSIANFV